MIVKINKTKYNPIDKNRILDYFENKTSDSFSEEKESHSQVDTNCTHLPNLLNLQVHFSKNGIA